MHSISDEQDEGGLRTHERGFFLLVENYTQIFLSERIIHK